MNEQQFGPDWGYEDGAWIHLESEMAVEQAEDGFWEVLNLDDYPVTRHFETAEQAVAYVNDEYAAYPRHAFNWSER